MNAELRRLFDQMGRVLQGPAEPEDRRLAIYARFVRGHVRAGLEKMYPLVRRALAPGRWDALVEAYRATRPARHFEPNRLAEGFPAFLAERVGPDGVPEWIPALAQFEWTDFEVYASEEPLEGLPVTLERLSPNPTLAILQHPFRICAWIRARDERGPEPERGEETALLWRHPRTHRTLFRAADDRALLVLKMALEGLSIEQVLQAGAFDRAELSRWIEEFAAEGLVLGRSAVGV